MPFDLRDPDPQATEHKILEMLAGLRAYESMQARAISRAVWGTDLAHRSNTASALGRLKTRHLVVEVRKNQWRITEAGRNALRLAELMDDGGDAA